MSDQIAASAAASGARSLWRRFTAAYHRLLDILLALSIAILIIPVSMQIFSRFTHIIPHFIWTEEMARFLFIWAIMLGAMIGVRESTHLEVDVWGLLSPRADAVLKLFLRLAILALALTFLLAGWEFTEFAWNRISELAELPLWLIHMAWPLTGLTWIIFLGEQTYDDVRTIIRGVRP